MKQKKEKTTILFVNKNSRGLKPIQVSSKLISNWKKYLAAICIIFLGLIGTIIYLTANTFQQEKFQASLSNKIHYMHNLFAEVDTNAIKKKFTKIDKQLSTIDSYLKARGVQNPNKGPQGGEIDNDVLSAVEIGEFYENRLSRLIYNIAHTPLGFPYPGAITSTFGHRENPFGGSNVETHKGMDIKGPLGGKVKAMAKGQVEFAGVKGGYGNCIVIKHGNGFQTLYGHLSKILVKPGQQIEIGEQIGQIGSTGRSTGPHLHYEIHRNGQKINPQSYLTLN